MVLDDAVMDYRQPVARDVRMRVALARHSMGGPAGVGDTDLAVGWGLLERIVEHAHLTNGAQPGEAFRAVEDGNTRRIVAAIFEPPQPLHQDRYDITLSNRSDDSAHDPLPQLRPGPLGRVAKFALNERKRLILLSKGVTWIAFAMRSSCCST